jgi:hypothetical protein
MNKIFAAILSMDIKNYFGFLFDSGYRIREVIYDWLGGYWKVALESANCLIYIFNDRGEIMLGFSSRNEEGRYSIGIETMVFFLSQGQNFIGHFEGDFSREKKKQFERLANLLKENIDEITPYFGNDFKKYKEDLILAQKKYEDLFLEKYKQKK